MPQKQHVIHGRDHCPTGADPIPCMITAPTPDSYENAVLTHPCVVHYWPADEPSGSLIDRVGDWDMTADTSDAGGYPQYGAGGPFTELPESTAIVNAGNYGATLPVADGRFYNNFGTAPFWDGTAPFAVEVWVYLTGYGSPVENGAILQAEHFSLDINAKKLRAGRGTDLLTDPADFPLNVWQYVVLSYDGTTLSLYRNAALVDSDSVSSSNIRTTLSWLNNYVGPSWAPLNGRSAQLALYDCALTADEIGDHYDLRSAGSSATAGLVLQTDGDGGTSWDQVDTPSVADNAITSAKIADGAIVNADVSASADIAPTKLSHPGGTTSFLRADGTWATPPSGGAPSGPAGGALDGSYPNPGLASSVAGAGLAESADVLSVNVDGSTLEVASDALRVKDAGITAAKIAPGANGQVLTTVSGAAAWADPAGGDPSLDALVWMPLTTTVGGVPELVWEADDSLIPTLTPI